MSFECTTDETRNNLAADGISGSNFIFFFNPQFLSDSENKKNCLIIFNFQVTLLLLELVLVETRSWDMEREKVEPGISLSLNKPCWKAYSYKTQLYRN